MDAEKVNIMVAGLAKKRQDLQSQIAKKREAILVEQKKIAKLEEQIADIEADINKIKIRASKEAERDQPSENPMDVEESDAATTTGALDGASQSTGGDFGGWRHYSKVGGMLKRPLPNEKKKKKKKKIVEFVDSFWGSVEDGEQ